MVGCQCRKFEGNEDFVPRVPLPPPHPAGARSGLFVGKNGFATPAGMSSRVLAPGALRQCA